MSAFSSTIGPLEVLMRRVSSAIFLNSFSPIKCRVESFNGQWMEMKSDSFQNGIEILELNILRSLLKIGIEVITLTPKAEILWPLPVLSFHSR